ncbi:carbohydrate ABC transporter substrate-binding protein [Gracilibacillus sp. D59]|uniref:carbohydrate ABC transporter substrate-binding protein n=1 Tax=Gracilibacillus sp. D59 TaxID=3457434 RepID=UPI003FCE64E3
MKLINESENKMMRKVIGGLVLLLLGLILFGCSSDDSSGSSKDQGEENDSESNGESEVLDIAVFEGAYGSDYWTAVADKFMEENPGTQINIESNPKIGDLIRPKIVSGNPPDLIYLNAADPSGVTQALIDEKGIEEITDLFDRTVPGEDVTIKEKLIDGALESKFMAPYGDGKVYLAPYNYNLMGLWYNKELFENESISIPETWDEFFDYTEVATEHDRALFTYQGIHPGYLEEILVPAIYDRGGQEALDQFLNYDPEFWKSDVALDVLSIFEQIGSTDNALMEGTIALNHTQSQTSFMQGDAMFIPNGNWFETEMEDAPTEDPFGFGFMGVPAFESGDTLTAQTSIEQIYIPKDSDNKELAKDFLTYLYTDESVLLNGEKAHGAMAVKGAVELVKDYITTSSYNAYKQVEKGEIYPVSSSFAALPSGTNINISDEVYKPAVEVLSGDSTAQEWADRLYNVYVQIQEDMGNE